MGRYIGARYVPIMGGAWDNSNEYEPLTVVQYEGDSYTSKKYVPVGVAITNTTYWVKTADYSQQLASLAQSLQQTDNRVQNIEGDIEDINREMPKVVEVTAASPVTLAAGAGTLWQLAATSLPTGYKVGGLLGVRFISSNNENLVSMVSVDNWCWDDEYNMNFTIYYKNKSDSSYTITPTARLLLVKAS